jgi:hypothetical protein
MIASPRNALGDAGYGATLDGSAAMTVEKNLRSYIR